MARSRTSGEYFLGLAMGYILSRNEPSDEPGTVQSNQDQVCAFVRQIVAARISETVALTGRPDRDHRDIKAVEELWESTHRRFAVEHTVIESFDGQLANIARIERLLVPVKDMLAGRLPGRFSLAVRATETSAARIEFAIAHREVARLVLDAANRLTVGETITLSSTVLPFELRLHLRFKEDSRLILHTDIEGDPEELRLERVRRALDAKCSKLATWAREGRSSILIIEADDNQHSNVFVVYQAVARAPDQLADGRRFRTLTVLDLYTRQCLDIAVGRGLTGQDVAATLERLRFD
ncbi:MAG TPA: hypothetical protein VNJ04_10940, partial [Gemmatimonadaceae bacterium]|nr:hypothetical protein [Gemmatimonadaceae bacterium]